MKSLIPVDHVERHIYLIRGQRVMLDSDLARVYEIPTFRLNEAIKRNQDRFPSDFMFRLTPKEFVALTSQFAMSKNGRGGRRNLPYAFTEHGALMAASVLNSPRAVQMSLFVIRAFVRLREMIASHRDLAKRLEAMEKHLAGHNVKLGKQAKEIRTVFEMIHHLMESTEKPRKPIGFMTNE